MLMVSDLLELASGQTEASALTARAPSRFEPTGSAPFVVVWNVCRHCNMTCPHCYASAGVRPSRQDLSTEEGRTLIEELAGAGVRCLIFSGGEPLLRADVIDLMAHAREQGISPQLSSNGVLIDAPMAERLADAGVSYVGVSIDGVSAFNDAYRGLEGGFDLAVRGLRCSREAGMRTGLRMTLTRRNMAHLPALVQLARSLPVDRFYVSHLVYSGRGRRLVEDDLDREESRTLLEALFGLADRLLAEGDPLRIVTGGNDSDGPALLRWVEEAFGSEAALRIWDALERRGGNSAGERVLCIDHQGRVHPDQFWQGATLGDVRVTPFAQILAHPLRAQLQRRTALLEGRCATCPFVTLCRGSHRERALATHGNPWAPDPACVMRDAEVAPLPMEALA
jgi:Fe-coproporphyrin III synthase